MSMPIRVRLTLWYIGVLAAVLLAFSAGVLWMQERYSRMQFDTELGSVAMTASGVLRSELAESHQLAGAASETRKAIDIPNRTVAILDGTGRPVAGHWRGFHRAGVPSLAGRSALTRTIVQGAEAWRVRLQREDSPDGPFMVLVAAAETPIAREHTVLARTLLGSMPVALLFSAVICWWVASRALAPLTQMSDEAERITVQSLNSGLSTNDSGDEVGQLGRAFNRLLGRVAAAVAAQRQFMADASHELRTPVSAARTAAEVTLAQPHRDEEEYRDALDVVRAQTRRLGRMVDDMFVLARADAGGYQIRITDCCADEVLAECAEAARVLATAEQVELEAMLEPGIPLCADEALLGQLTLNLLENAIKHTPPRGRVRLELRRTASDAEITVIDSGCGIPLADRDRIFERFVRLDQAREALGGAGLGLPIARWIAESHGGTLTLEGTGASGSTFVARLPLGLVRLGEERLQVRPHEIGDRSRAGLVGMRTITLHQ
jgi:signal transduction histidine kinase